jgi:hypothetical protein
MAQGDKWILESTAADTVPRKIGHGLGRQLINLLKHNKKSGDCFSLTAPRDVKAGEVVQVTLGDLVDKGDVFHLELPEGVEP